MDRAGDRACGLRFAGSLVAAPAFRLKVQSIPHESLLLQGAPKLETWQYENSLSPFDEFRPNVLK